MSAINYKPLVIFLFYTHSQNYAQNIALAKATEQCNELLGSGKGSDKTQYRLGWKVDDLSCLNTNGRKLLVELSSFVEKLRDPMFDLQSFNFSLKLTNTRKELNTFIAALSKHTRVAATHIMVFMISPAQRDTKPYAIPIQCVPYRGMTEARLRKFVDQIVHEMHHRGMKVAGLLYIMFSFVIVLTTTT